MGVSTPKHRWEARCVACSEIPEKSGVAHLDGENEELERTFTQDALDPVKCGEC